MPLNNRKYSVGDRVVMLGKMAGGEVRGAHDCAAASYMAPRITQEPFVLIDCVVRDLYKDRNGDVIVLRHHAVMAGPEEDIGLRDSEVALSERWLGSRLQNLRTAMAQSADLTPEKMAFLKQFVVPVVVSSGGYQAMLRDFAAIVNPAIVVPAASDLASIQATATEMGIGFRSFLGGNKTAGYYGPFNDLTSAMYDGLEEPAKKKAPQINAGNGVVQMDFEQIEARVVAGGMRGGAAFVPDPFAQPAARVREWVRQADVGGPEAGWDVQPADEAVNRDGIGLMDANGDIE